MTKNSVSSNWDTAYEWRAVVLLGLGFGLVSLDRWILGPLFPAMMVDLGLTYQNLGNLAGILAISWGIFATLMGRMSDRFGRRKILIPALILFSCLSGFTGLVSGIAALYAVRAVMGASEGAYLASSVAATGDASHPSRRGLNQGLQMSTFSLMGFGLAPIIATQLLAYVPSWRYVFVLVALPGLLLAAVFWRVVREPAHITSELPPQEKVRWRDLFASRNVVVAMLAILCAMSCIFVLGAMVPSYLVDFLHLSAPRMGVVMSALGFGGFLGQLVIPAVSDYVGRRPTCVLAFIGAAVTTYVLMNTGAEPGKLFEWLFAVAFFCLGILTLLTGPVASEAVPVVLLSSSIGLVSGAGEIFGGGVGPVIAGFVAQKYGIQHVLAVPLVGLCIGIIVSAFLRETAPRKLLSRLPLQPGVSSAR